MELTNVSVVDPMKQKLEEWKLQKGRVNKSDKPWIPKFKKSIGENVVGRQDLNSTMPNLKSRDPAKTVQVKSVTVVKKTINKTQTDLNIKSRSEQLEEWKMKKKLREEEFKQIKAKERRWTICGTASNYSRRESETMNMSNFNNLTRILTEQNVEKPKLTLPDANRSVVQKKFFKNVQVQQTIAKPPIPPNKVTVSTLKSQVAVNKVPINTVKTETTKTPHLTTAKLPIAAGRPSLMPKKDQIVTTNVPEKVQTIAKSLTTAKHPTTGRVSLLPKKQTNPNVKVSVKTDKAQATNTTAAKPPINTATSKNLISVPNNSTATKSVASQARVSISALHRNPNWKLGRKENVKPSGENKQLHHKVTEIKKAGAVAVNKPWNSGTIIKNAPKVNSKVESWVRSAVAAKIKRPDGILKNSSQPKSARPKRNVVFISPVRSPDDPPLNERLMNWLLENNHSPCDYRQLQCFGSTLVDASPVKDLTFGSEEDETLKSPATPDTVILETSNVNEEQTHARLRNVLDELNRLLQNSYPVSQASEWLDVMYERIPEVRLMAAYWLCRARVSVGCGCSLEDVVELVEQGIAVGAQPIQELVNFKRSNSSRRPTPRPKKDCGKENIFNSTIVKFKVGESESQPPKQVSHVDTPLRVTPVRRSHRLIHCRSESIFNSIDEIPSDMKSRLVLTPNRFLDVDFGAKSNAQPII